ncbi:MAG TPA: helix-turn-helix domain-containing protein [Mycobacteriales bacterium]|nr:helix-turn-helix domain-containing protein [Mycobacteriales bacterium]
MSETYAEWAPPRDLAADVQCVWWSSFGPAAPILPDGHLDLIIGGDRVLIAGPDTAVAPNDFPAGLVVHGVRFRTGRAHRVLGVPAEELRDQRVDLTDLWGADGRRVAERLIENPQRHLGVVAAALADRPPEPDREVDAAIRRLVVDRPRVGDLPGELGISERQLRRRFTAAVGYGPAMFNRVVRMQRVRRLAESRPHDGLADLAFAAGYSDQAHMSREIKNLTGMTARALLRGRFVQE